jgi:hypothetical protein
LGVNSGGTHGENVLWIPQANLAILGIANRWNGMLFTLFGEKGGEWDPLRHILPAFLLEDIYIRYGF